MGVSSKVKVAAARRTTTPSKLHHPNIPMLNMVNTTPNSWTSSTHPNTRPEPWRLEEVLAPTLTSMLSSILTSITLDSKSTKSKWHKSGNYELSGNYENHDATWRLKMFHQFCFDIPEIRKAYLYSVWKFKNVATCSWSSNAT